jgi:sec-independent protein translocase protein TatB
MFSWSEILLIAVVALIFIGPKELPAILHKLGQMTASLRRSAEEFRRHFEQSMREAGYEDLHKNINDLRSLNPSTQLRATIDSAINQSYAPVPQPAGTQPSAAPSFANGAQASVTPAAEAGAAGAGASVGSSTHSDRAGEMGASASKEVAAVPGAQQAAVGPIKDHAAPVA